MKILLVNSLYYPNTWGGAERSVQFLAEALVQSGHEVVVICTNPSPGTEFQWVNRVKVYYIRLKNLYWPFKGRQNPLIRKLLWHVIDIHNPWMAHEVARILDVERPDVVHTNNLLGFSTLVWRMIKQRGLPLVHTLRDYYLLCMRSCMFHNNKNCEVQCWYCRPSVLPRRHRSGLVDAVVGISEFILDRHLKLGYFLRTPIRKVIFSSYRPTSMLSREHIPKKSTLQLGYIGRLHPTKGIEFLLSTLEHLPRKGWELWIAGKSTEEYEAYLHRRYALSDFHYLGFIEPEKLFSKIDVLVVPSLWDEPLGRIVFEAYAYGVPVIGSNRGGISEIVEEGHTGFIFDPMCAGALEKAIERFMSDPGLACRLGKNALLRSEEFTPERIVAKYLQVYEAVKGKGP